LKNVLKIVEKIVFLLLVFYASMVFLAVKTNLNYVQFHGDSFFARGSQLESVQKMNLNDPSRRPSSNRVYNA